MAAPAIVVADNRDGTATVTISGTLLHTYDAYARRIDGTAGDAGWVFIGFVALLNPPGVEQFAVTLAKGLYAFYATGGGEVSTVYMRMVTNAAEDSLHERIWQAVHATLLTLPFPGVVEVKRIDLPAEAETTRVKGLPAVLTSLFRTQPTYVDRTNGADDTGFPVMVSYLFGDATKDGPEPPMTMYQEIVRRAFRAKRLSGVPEAYLGSIEPGPLGVVDIPDTKTLLKSSTQILRFMAREQRA
jgi:hypothetical protein